jgi:hypothetical protein
VDENPERKLSKRERLVKELLFHHIDELVPQIAYTANEFSEILCGRSVDTSNRVMMKNIEQLKGYIKPEHPMLANSI